MGDWVIVGFVAEDDAVGIKARHRERALDPSGDSLENAGRNSERLSEGRYKTQNRDKQTLRSSTTRPRWHLPPRTHASRPLPPSTSSSPAPLILKMANTRPANPTKRPGLVVAAKPRRKAGEGKKAKEEKKLAKERKEASVKETKDKLANLEVEIVQKQQIQRQLRSQHSRNPKENPQKEVPVSNGIPSRVKSLHGATSIRPNANVLHPRRCLGRRIPRSLRTMRWTSSPSSQLRRHAAAGRLLLMTTVQISQSKRRMRSRRRKNRRPRRTLCVSPLKQPRRSSSASRCQSRRRQTRRLAPTLPQPSRSIDADVLDSAPDDLSGSDRASNTGLRT